MRFANRFRGDFYLEAQPHHDWDKQVELNGMILSIADSLKIPIVVTPDCHYSHANEETFHDALIAVSSRIAKDDPKRTWRFSTKECYIKTPEGAVRDLTAAGFSPDASRAALLETGKIADKIEDWDWDDLPKPAFPIIKGDLRQITMNEMARMGLKGKPEYEERVAKELDTFINAGPGIDKYLLLVRHCIRLFKDHGAEIGPRGSVGGSLVAYCLGITPLDPIIHNLSWQRFYAPGRTNMPDADIDIDEAFRVKAPEILQKEFGEDRIAQISNYTTFGSRMSVKDAARAYGIKIEDRSHYDLSEKEMAVDEIEPGKELARKSPDAIAFARKMVGRIRQYGAHAGGFVISSTSLYGGRSAVVSRGKGKALCWDMKTAEKLGFIKLDFLGIDSLSAIRAVGEITSIEWNDVPLDDKQVMDDFSGGLTAGVPQFLSPGLKSFCRNLKPKKFNDLVWANAAFRPGGLEQMSPEELAKRYNDDGAEGVMIFQEEVMDACVNIAGFTWMEADKIRKKMSKSEGKAEIEKFRTKFVAGCQKTVGWSENEANSFYDLLVGFGRYAFNRSHAVAYSWNSYRIAWAKRHYPKEAFAALLNCNENQKHELQREAPKYGVKILPPDPNISGLTWQKDDEGIRTPLTAIGAIDLRVAKNIIKNRKADGPFQDRVDFDTRVKCPSVGADDLYSGQLPDETFRLPLKDVPKEYTKSFLESVKKDVRACIKCNLRMTCRKVVPPDFGNTNVLVVGEAPGKDEERLGRPFVGASGRLVDDLLMDRGITAKDLSFSNVSHCKPPYVPKGQNRDEIDELMAACPWVDDVIKMLQPPLILLLGKFAFQRFSGEKKKSIMKANGSVFEKNGSKVVVSVHPSFVLHSPGRRPEIERAFDEFAHHFSNLVPPKEDPERRSPDAPSAMARARQFFNA